MVKKTFHAAILFAVLFATWFALSGISSKLFLIYGAISCTLATLLTLRMHVLDNEGHPFHLAIAAPLYWLWLFKEMIKSGLSVTRAVWSPWHKITPNFAWVPSTQHCDLGRTIFANSITLTPGTVCVDIDKKKAFVHALEQASVDDLNEGTMDRSVTRLTSGKHHSKKKGHG
ncbi:MAG: Na+/H+ antiporter subunit E [Alphaproteobacteria bacterium]|nr:Na+/H+ antiporter subunit E [Alphaproteobacteria bacterium]